MRDQRSATADLEKALIRSCLGDPRIALLLISVCGPEHGCLARGKNPGCYEGSNWNRKACERYGRNDGGEIKRHGAGIMQHVMAGGNVGLVPHGGIVVLDADSQDAFDWLLGLAPTAPRSQRTAGRGHFFFRTAEILTQRKPRVDVDVRTNFGGFVVLPPSIHKSGEPYQWTH